MEMVASDYMRYVTMTLTFCLHLSGLPPCLTMLKTRSTEFPFAMMILVILNCSGMIYYSQLIGETLMFYLNVVGVSLTSFYISCYLYVLREKALSFTILFAVFLFQCRQIHTVYYDRNHNNKLNYLGTNMMIVAILLNLSVAWEMIKNFKDKNAKGMPKIMIISNLLCALSWLIYGLLLNDFYIYFPSIPGSIILSLKLVAFHIYHDKPKED